MCLLSDGRNLEPAVDYRVADSVIPTFPALLLGGDFGTLRLPRGTLKYFYRTDSGALRRFIG